MRPKTFKSRLDRKIQKVFQQTGFIKPKTRFNKGQSPKTKQNGDMALTSHLLQGPSVTSARVTSWGASVRAKHTRFYLAICQAGQGTDSSPAQTHTQESPHKHTKGENREQVPGQSLRPTLPRQHKGQNKRKTKTKQSKQNAGNSSSKTTKKTLAIPPARRQKEKRWPFLQPQGNSRWTRTSKKPKRKRKHLTWTGKAKRGHTGLGPAKDKTILTNFQEF